MQRQALALALFALSFATPGKAEETVLPGHYVLPGDSGTLEIKSAPLQTRFALESVGANGHICTLSGVIHGTTGVADDWLEESRAGDCRIAFHPGKEQIEVEALTPEPCRNYCGARASFEGTYKIPPKNCTLPVIQTRRTAFLEDYRAHRYAMASTRQKKLLDECGKFVNWVAIDALRNDLALAQFHSGQADACLRTLAATRAAQAGSEDELGLPPSDHENYIATAKATWHNQGLCKKGGAYRPLTRKP